MAVNYQFVKRYENLAGVDYKSSDLKFPEQYATALRNIQFTNTGAIEKRKGYQGAAETTGGQGLFTYKTYNATTGAETVELISIGDNAYKLNEGLFTVQYSGAATLCEISIYYDAATSVYRCKIIEGTTTVLDYDLGLGIDETTPVTVTDLATQIGMLAGFLATSTVGTMPAAMLDTTISHDLTSSDLELSERYWEQLNAPITPFPGNATYKNDANFENTSGVQLYNILYLSNGYDAVKKYDGQNIYNAGLPSPASGVAAVGAATGLTGTYNYKITYLQKDNQGNEYEGNVFTSNSVTVANQKIDLTVANILAASGYNTNCAVVAGAQGPVNTIVVDDGSGGVHTMKVGDTAYFYDAVSASYVERLITSVDTTAPTYSITVAGAAVTVADNAVISNNLRIKVYRNQNGVNTVWYEQGEYPNNSFTSTQVITDNTADNALGAVFVEPATDRSPPPQGRYISTFQGLLVTSGSLQNVNTVSFSDIEFPEYFPVPDNQVIVSDIIGDRITGMSPSNEFFIIFQSQGIHVLSGDFVGQSYKVDQVANDIGCAAHASIQDVRGALMFMSLQGPRVLQGGQVPRGLGPFEQNPFVSRIDPIFDQAGESNPDKIWKLKRSVSFHDRVNQKYWLFIPCETQNNDVYANENSIAFVYEYPRDAWLEWDKINLAGGVVEWKRQVLFSERDYSGFLGGVRSVLYKIHNTNTNYDYADNNAAILCYWKSAWDFLGEASILKSFLAVTIFSTGTVENDFTLTFRTEVNWLPDTKSEVSVVIGSDGYGVGPYGTGQYGDPVEPTYPRKLNNNRVKSIRAVLVNEEMQKNIGVTGYEFEIAAPYKPRFVQ